jgi:hypothetical protein
VVSWGLPAITKNSFTIMDQ